MIGNSISHFTILEKIGEGGMGIVYKAEHTKLKRSVASKILPVSSLPDRAGKERLFHEARAAAAVRHSGKVTVHDIDDIDGQVSMAMDRVEGRTQRNKIAGSPAPPAKAISISAATEISQLQRPKSCLQKQYPAKSENSP